MCKFIYDHTDKVCLTRFRDMIPCEFCREMIRPGSFYSHATTCVFMFQYNRNRILQTTISNLRTSRHAISDLLASLTRNERLDAQDEDALEEEAFMRFDAYDELDERIDINNNSPIRYPLIRSQPRIIVPVPQQPQRYGFASSYERNLALADRIGRVVVGVKNINKVLTSICNSTSNSNNDDTILCPICQDMCLSNECVVTNPCKHSYCEPCIIKWLSQSKFCPVCKHEFNEN